MKRNISNNKMIMKRRKKRQLKRTIMLSVLLISAMIILAFKLPYFNIKNVEIQGNKAVSSKIIADTSGIFKGNNIFYLNIQKARENILKISYVSNVSIYRKLPDKIIINITERNARYFVKLDKSYLIVDNDGIILEKRNDLKGLKLTEVIGVKPADRKIGESIFTNSSRSSQIEILNTFSDLIERNKSNNTISSIDLSDILDLKVYYGKMCVKLGTKDNLKSKLNKALNILSLNQLKNAKGYIDVSYEGNPVFFIEK